MNTQANAPEVAQQNLEPGIGVLDLITWLGEGKRKIVAVTVAAIVASVTYALLQPNIFTARTTLLPAGAQQQSGSSAALAALGSLGGLAGSLGSKGPDELYVYLLRSDTVQRLLDEQFDLKSRYEVKTNIDLRLRLGQHVRVTSDKKSGVITVDVDDKDPKFAADLANAHATAVSKLLSRLAVSEAQQRRVFFETQLKETKDNLIAAEQALRELQEKSGVMVLDKQAEAIMSAAAQIRTRIAEREIQLRVLRTRATAANPEVQLLNSELQALRGELARVESNNGRASDGRTNATDLPLTKLPSTAIEYIRATREMKFQETMLASMLRQFEVAKLDEAKDAPALQQVDVAIPPDRKSKPIRSKMVITATVLGLFGSIAWVLLSGFVRTARARDPEGEQAITNLRNAWRWKR